MNIENNNQRGGSSSTQNHRQQSRRAEIRINDVVPPHYSRRSSMFKNFTFDQLLVENEEMNNNNNNKSNDNKNNNDNNIIKKNNRRATISQSQQIPMISNHDQFKNNQSFNQFVNDINLTISQQQQQQQHPYNTSSYNHRAALLEPGGRMSLRYRRRSQRFKRQIQRYSAQHTPLEEIHNTHDEQDEHPFVPRTFSFLPLPEFKGARLHYRFTEGIRSNSTENNNNNNNLKRNYSMLDPREKRRGSIRNSKSYNSLLSSETNQNSNQQNDELMLFCHGLGTTMVLFNPLVKACVESGYSVVCLDFLGRGKSDYPYGLRPHDAAFFTRQMMLLLERTGLLRRYRRLTLVGHSMGAAACIHFTHAYGHLVDRLILLAPAGFMWEHRLLSLSKTPIVGKFAEMIGRRMIASVDSEEMVRQEFYSWRDLPFEYQEGLKEHAIWHAQNNKNLSHAVMSSIRDFPLRELIPEITSVGRNETRPILVVWGNKDTVCPFGQGSFIFESKMKLERMLVSEEPKNWRRVLAVVPNCSHSVFLERAHDVEDVIIRFMKNTLQ